MAAINAELFQHTTHRYKNIKLELRKHLPEEVAGEVIAFVGVKTEEKFDEIWGFVSKRYERLNALYDSFSENDTKAERNKKLQRFFELTKPKDVIDELKEIIRFEEIEKDYKHMIDSLSNGLYGEVFNQYQFDSNMFDFFKHGLLIDLKNLTGKLEKYTEHVGKHILLLQQIQESKKSKGFVKGGFSALGMLLGVPFMGTAAGALMGAGQEGQQSESIQKSG